MNRCESDLPSPPEPRDPDDYGPRPSRPLVVVSEYPVLVTSIRSAVVHSEFTIVGTTMTSGEATLLLESHPDAVLLLATHDPVALLTLVRERFPDVTAIVFDDSATPEMARVALSQGARGFVASTIEPAELVPALRQILGGTSFRVVGISPADLGLDDGELTDLEREMLEAVAEGVSNMTIAKRFDVAEPTVKLRLTRIYRKLGVRNRTEAARWLFEHARSAETPPDR
jgi:DNA-binding NarL/FixJ family response regulator